MSKRCPCFGWWRIYKEQPALYPILSTNVVEHFPCILIMMLKLIETKTKLIHAYREVISFLIWQNIGSLGGSNIGSLSGENIISLTASKLTGNKPKLTLASRTIG